MRKSKLVYRVCWIKLDTGGKDYGRNNHSNHGVKEEARLHDWAVQIEAQQRTESIPRPITIIFGSSVRNV